MKQHCASYHHFKGFRVPRCNCLGCWKKYFDVNKHETMAALTVIKGFGTEGLEALKGTKYVSMLKLLRHEELNDRASTT